MKINLYIKTISLRGHFLDFRSRCYTAISRKVVGKNVHATIPKGNMGYDQYTVPDDCSCRSYFCCFPLALANTFPRHFVPIPSYFFEKKRTQNHPQCLSGLSRALFSTTFLEIAVYTSLYRSAEPELLFWRQSFSFGTDVVYQV